MATNSRCQYLNRIDWNLGGKVIGNRSRERGGPLSLSRSILPPVAKDYMGRTAAKPTPLSPATAGPRAMLLYALLVGVVAQTCPMIMDDTTFGGGIALPGTVTAEGCCAACMVAAGCRQWAFDGACRIEVMGWAVGQRGAVAGTKPESPPTRKYDHSSSRGRSLKPETRKPW